ncbi:MAG: hypothetical protein QXO21_04215, partial [Candidatus Anstonellales archaeon]
MKKSFKSKGFVLSITIVFFVMLFVYDISVWHELNASKSRANAEFLKYLIQRSMLEKSDMQVKGILEAALINSMANITKWVANNSYLEIPSTATGDEAWMESDYFNFTLNHLSKICNKQISPGGIIRETLKNKINNEWENTVNEYIKRYNNSLYESGFEFNLSLKDCDAKLMDYKTVNANFNYSYNLTSLDGNIKIQKSGEISINVTIENILDPVPTIELKKAKGCTPTSTDLICLNPYIKKIYFDNENRIKELSDLNVIQLLSVSFPNAYGKGFSYGKVVKYSDIQAILSSMPLDLSNTNAIIQYYEKFNDSIIYLTSQSELNHFITLASSADTVNRTWGLIYYSAGIVFKKEALTTSSNIFRSTGVYGTNCEFYETSSNTKFLPHFNITKFCYNSTTKNLYGSNFEYFLPVETMNIFYGVNLDAFIGQPILITTNVGNFSKWAPSSATTAKDSRDLSIKVYNIANLRKVVKYGIYFNGSDKFASFVQRHYGLSYLSNLKKGLGGFIHQVNFGGPSFATFI